MKFEDWIEEVPDDIVNVPFLWKFDTYRRALFLSDINDGVVKNFQM